jgi:hypothetical protein
MEMSTMTDWSRLEQMREHVARLAIDIPARIHWHEGVLTQSYADMVYKEVGIPPVVSTISYAACLHELGHLATLKGVDVVYLGFQYAIAQKFHLPIADVIEAEKKAWGWARKEALVWNEHMEELKAVTMLTYTTPLEERSAEKKQQIFARIHELEAIRD